MIENKSAIIFVNLYPHSFLTCLKKSFCYYLEPTNNKKKRTFAPLQKQAYLGRQGEMEFLSGLGRCARQDLMLNQKTGLELSTLFPGWFMIHFPLSALPIDLIQVAPCHILFWNLNKWCFAFHYYLQEPSACCGQIEKTFLRQLAWKISLNVHVSFSCILRLPSTKRQRQTQRYKTILHFSRVFSSILPQIQQILFKFRLSRR